MKTIVLLLDIFGCRLDNENQDLNVSIEKKSSKTIIDRIAKSYADYVDGSENIDYFSDSDPEEYGISRKEDFSYLEIGNGKIMIFKGSQVKGKVPKKYKSKVNDQNILTEDIVVENLNRAKEILNFK